MWRSGIFIAAAAVTSSAAAQPCPEVRPTDAAGGLLHYADPANVVHHDASDRVRVFYATLGPDAPLPSSPGPSGAPENVELVGRVVDEALSSFADMGFRAPLGDGDYAPCASNGGDARLDVYLIGFPSGADGSAGTDTCAGSPLTCSGFILLENDFASSGYSSFEEAARTVAPHELFHLVQDAYDAQIDRWWAEGTAQWAADRLHPELEDLERFLPTFFANPGRALDASAGGVTNAWLYATAIWPVFLTQRFGPQHVRDVFEAVAAGSSPVLQAVEDTATAAGDSLAQSFVDFASFNAATGERASAGQGYDAAASYPTVVTTDLPPGLGRLEEGVLSGLAARYFISLEPRRLSLDADPEAVSAVAIPLDGGLATRVALPADVPGDAVLVVAGKRVSHIDAPFALVSEAIPEPEPEPSSEPQPPPPVSSCGFGGARPPTGGLAWLLVVFALSRRRNASPTVRQKTLS